MSQPTGASSAPTTVGGVDGTIINEGVRDASDADLAGFRHAAPANPDDFMPSHPMMGDEYQHMQSARHDTRARGFTTANVTSPAAFDNGGVEEADFIGADQPFAADAPAVPQPDAAPSWQQRFGQSENEKGEWRRLAESESAARIALEQRLAALELRGMAPQQYAPQYTSQQPAQIPQVNLDPNRAPDDVATIADLNAVLNRYVYPIGYEARDSAYQSALADVQRLPQMGWDVSQSEEASIRSRHPSIALMPLRDQNQLILEHAHATRPAPASNAPTSPLPATRPQMTPVAPARVQVVNPERVLQRQTFVESAAPVSAPPESGSTLTPGQRVEREMAQLDAQARARGLDRAPASVMKEVLLKYGVKQVNDFGGQVLTR